MFKKRFAHVLKGIENKSITRPIPQKLYSEAVNNLRHSWNPLLLSEEAMRRQGLDPSSCDTLFKSAVKRCWNQDKARLMTSSGPDSLDKIVIVTNLTFG